MKKVLVLNGPNLNLLGSREPGIYGDLSLEQIAHRLEKLARELDVVLDIRQSNSEAELLGWLQQTDGFSAVVINPAALTHYSIGLRDVISVVRDRGIRVVECHLSNPAAREVFRHESLISGVSNGVVAGFGAESYALALRAAVS